MKTSATVLVLLALLALIPCTQSVAQTPAVTTAQAPASTAEFLATLSTAPDLDGTLTPAPQFLATTCTSSAQCPSGQLCCYPCGIDGCDFVCMKPMNGHCPRFP